MNQEVLLVDSCNGNGFFLDLNESANGGLTRFRGKFQEAEAVNKNKRIYPRAILDENVKKLNETIRDGGLSGELDHPCAVSPDYQVLTPDGWKEFKEIREGDLVFSRVNGEMFPSQVTAVIDQPYDGKAIQVKGRAIDCTFTAPHKFVVCKRKDGKRPGEQFYATIDEIHANRTKFSHDYIPKTATWQGDNRETIVLSGVDRPRLSYAREDLEVDAVKFGEFLGLYLAEGCLKTGKHTNRVEISQKTEYGKVLVRNILNDFHPDVVWKECKSGFYTADARLYDYLVPLGNKYTKYVPKEVKALSPKVLERLIVAFAVGDGRILKSEDGGKTCLNHKLSEEELSLDNGKFSRMSVFSVSERLVDDLHECLVKCGGCGSREVVTTEEDYSYAGRTIKAKNKKPLYCLNLSRADGIGMDPRHLKTIETRHTGRIYCLTTQYGNFYMKYKGHSFWTGNCDSIIHLANVSHRVSKLWWEGNVLMGEGEILNTPHGKILKALINDGVRVGISSRGVGNGKVNEEGILVIGESYKLITFDAVADPSTFHAFQKEVVSSKKEGVTPERVFSDATPENTSTGVYKLNKNQLIACLGGIVKSKTNEIKRGLNNG